MNRNLILITTAAISLLGCAQDVEPSVSEQTQFLAASQGAAAFSGQIYRLKIERRDRATLAANSRSAASAMLLGRTLASSNALDSISTVDGSDYAVDEASGIHVAYNPEFDALRLINVPVSTDYTSETDIGEARAAELFRTVAASLVSARVTDAVGLDFAKPELRLGTQSEGWAGQEPKTRTKEYIFFARRTLGGAGIRFGVQEAGVQVAIHRSGNVASLRVVGPKVVDVSKQNLPALVAEADVERLVARKYDHHSVRRHGLEYVYRPELGDFRLSRTYGLSSNTKVNGREIHGRVEYVSYPIDDINAVHSWPKQEPEATGDRRP